MSVFSYNTNPAPLKKSLKAVVFLFSLLLLSGSLHAQPMTPQVVSFSTNKVDITYRVLPVADLYEHGLTRVGRGDSLDISNTKVMFGGGHAIITYSLGRPLARYIFAVRVSAFTGPASKISTFTHTKPIGRFPVVGNSEIEISASTDSITLKAIDYPESLKDAFLSGTTINPRYLVSLELDGKRQGDERELGEAIKVEATAFSNPLILKYGSLMSETNYEIVMTVSTDSTSILNSRPARFAAHTLALRLPRPTGFMVEVGTTTATLTWDEADAGNANTYQISLDGKVQGEVPVANEVYTLMDLDPGRGSCLRIVARAPGFEDSLGRTYRLKDGEASEGCVPEVRLRAFLEGPVQ